MTVFSQEKPFGVLNYSPSNLMVWTKGASLILKIGSAIINTIPPLHLLWFYCITFILKRVFNFYLLWNSYGISCLTFYLIRYCFTIYLRPPIFCKLYSKKWYLQCWRSPNGRNVPAFKDKREKFASSYVYSTYTLVKKKRLVSFGSFSLRHHRWQTNIVYTSIYIYIYIYMQFARILNPQEYIHI